MRNVSKQSMNTVLKFFKTCMKKQIYFSVLSWWFVKYFYYSHDTRFLSQCKCIIRSTTVNCPVYGNYGGWWHNKCAGAFPNAIYGRTTSTWRGIIWYDWKRQNSLKTTMLKVKCNWFFGGHQLTFYQRLSQLERSFVWVSCFSILCSF